MVQNVASLRRKFREAPKIVHERLEKGLARIGDDVVREMSGLNPLPGTIIIDWTWGDAPAGAVELGAFGKEDREGMTITIFATARTARTAEHPDGFPAIARWWEFGTRHRVQETTGRSTGSIPAQPYFWPVWRSNRSRVKARINGILRRAIRKANQL